MSWPCIIHADDSFLLNQKCICSLILWATEHHRQHHQILESLKVAVWLNWINQLLIMAVVNKQQQICTLCYFKVVVWFWFNTSCVSILYMSSQRNTSVLAFWFCPLTCTRVHFNAANRNIFYLFIFFYPEWPYGHQLAPGSAAVNANILSRIRLIHLFSGNRRREWQHISNMSSLLVAIRPSLPLLGSDWIRAAETGGAGSSSSCSALTGYNTSLLFVL